MFVAYKIIELCMLITKNKICLKQKKNIATLPEMQHNTKSSKTMSCFFQLLHEV